MALIVVTCLVFGIQCFDWKECKESDGLPGYADDEYCDDENNNAACEFDGGACCMEPVKKNYCKDCKCLSKPKPKPTEKPKPGPKPKPKPTEKPKPPPSEGCGQPGYATDDYCDDENNNAGCDFDGGACCKEPVKKNYCKECKCLSKPKPKPTEKPKPGPKPKPKPTEKPKPKPPSEEE